MLLFASHHTHLSSENVLDRSLSSSPYHDDDADHERDDDNHNFFNKY